MKPMLEMQGLSPYWMNRLTCVLNDVSMNGIIFLTSPNMAGKSTLMRSILVASLLGNCGLYVPCKHAIIPRFNSFFLRTASYDIPSEAKSAFALEMDDVRIVLRDSSYQSLVMLDEIGKGTSSKDGSCISGALLEYLDQLQVYTIFATHLHEILQLPLNLSNIQYMKMDYDVSDSTNDISKRFYCKWKYKLVSGVCTDSMALFTAQQYRINDSILQRTQELLEVFDSTCRNALLDNLTSTITSEDNIMIYKDEDYMIPDMMKMICKHLQLEESQIIFVESQEIPPPSLEGQACVYVLILPSQTLYVGETESIRQRLEQHRISRKISFNAIIIPAVHKSQARLWEMVLIERFSQLKVSVERDSDKNHVLFSRQT